MDFVNANGKRLSAEQLEHMGRIQYLKNQLADELTKLHQHNHASMPAVLDDEGVRRAAEIDRSNDSLFEARRALQTGFMWLNRAITNPEGL